MSASGSKLPPVQWAQRSDKLWLTIDLQEAHDPQIKLQNQDDHGRLSFQGAALSHAAEAEPQQYALELDLYGKIDEEASKISVSARKIVLVIAKAESGHWPRLLQKSGKGATNIKVDWDKWVDEDEEEEGGKDDFDTEGLTNMSNFDLGGPGGMQEMMAKMQAGGMGGMGGMGGGPPGAGGMGGFGGMGGAPPDAGGFGGMGGLGDDFGSGDLGAGGAGLGIEEDSEDDEPPPLPTSS